MCDHLPRGPFSPAADGNPRRIESAGGIDLTPFLPSNLAPSAHPELRPSLNHGSAGGQVAHVGPGNGPAQRPVPLK